MAKKDSGYSLDRAMEDIKKSYGEGSIWRMANAPRLAIEAIPTGSLYLDRALGIGGLPRGRVIEIYGPESSGKTTLSLHVAASAQARGDTAAIVDVEHALDPTYAEAIGVNIEQLIVSQPDAGEQALEIVERLAKTGEVAVIIVDSVAALTPRAEIEGEMGDSHVGLHARLMSQALRKLTPIAHQTGTTIIFINQLREKIGVMFGSPETTPGGKALKFYASVRLDIRRIESLKDGVEVIGNRTRVKVVKNKVGPPFTKAEFDIMYGKGINYYHEVLDLGVEYEVIKKSGSWFSYKDVQIGQGWAQVCETFEDHPEMAREIVDAIAFIDQAEEPEADVQEEPEE